MQRILNTTACHNGRELAEALAAALSAGRASVGASFDLTDAYFDQPIRLTVRAKTLSDGSEVINLSCY